MDKWQAFVPGTDGHRERPLPSTVPATMHGPVPTPALPATPSGPESTAPLTTGQEERARTLSLIDFLADYDARRNPPVYDIRKYDLFLLRDADLPDVPGVRLSPPRRPG